MMELRVLLALVLIKYSFVLCNSESQCSSVQSSDMFISISSYKNQTGHWVAKVVLEHDDISGTGHGNSNKGLWDVNVQQTRKKCNGQQSIQIIATIAGPPAVASPGYEYFSGIGYYKFHKTPNTWDAARKMCEQEGGHLAVINSEEESKVIQKYLETAPKLENASYNDYAFIGFHDRFIEGEYLTVFGTSLESTGFTRWSGVGEPSNAGGKEHCGSAHRNGGLNDIPCASKLAFFCEQEGW
ncbi:hypothetical protein L9F63_000510 [Diploptera punctata]|uniref:C-type lectin domain-containing protein n=1 Tax=Diploptera punctata TaxID=6984 RepID=A0AAD8ALG8_DIPPU|nr:hypothetical protein L9F63_000510 [Diploptera punctata]